MGVRPELESWVLKQAVDSIELLGKGMNTPLDNENNSKPDQDCTCLAAPYGQLVCYQELGMDDHYAEVSLLVCPICGRSWLRYFFEIEAFAGSGRWYLGEITAGQVKHLKAENAKETLEGLNWYFSGGSYFGGRISKSSGRIMI